MISRASAALLAAALGTACTAQAVNFGLQAGLTIPSGDITRTAGSDPAFSYGAQARIQVRNGHAIVARLDMVNFNGTDDQYGGPLAVKDKIFSLGVAYNYYFSRRMGQGFFLGGGLGYIQKQAQYSAPAGYEFNPGMDPSKTNDRAFLDLQLGYSFDKHLSLAGRLLFFGDEQNGERYNSQTGNYEATYALTTLVTFGVQYHF